MHYPELLRFLHHFLDGVNAWIAKFHHLIAIGANQMIMLAVGKGLFVLTYVFAKLMPCYKKAVFQQFKGIVKRGPAHLIFPVLHGLMQRLHIKMPASGINFLQNGKAFGRFSKLTGFQVRFENLAHFFKNLRIEGHLSEINQVSEHPTGANVKKEIIHGFRLFASRKEWLITKHTKEKIPNKIALWRSGRLS